MQSRFCGTEKELRPAKGDGAGAVRPLLDQGLVELSTSTGVDGDPAVLAIVLEAGYVGAEERSKFA